MGSGFLDGATGHGHPHDPTPDEVDVHCGAVSGWRRLVVSAQTLIVLGPCSRPSPTLLTRSATHRFSRWWVFGAVPLHR